jgi:hypothetical protein
MVGLAVARGEKKTDKLIKLKKLEKNNQKNRTEKNQINRLKNHKKVLVRFGFGFDFQNLKLIDQIGSTRPTLKKKVSINRMFPNPKPKVTFSPPHKKVCSLHLPPPFAFCISPYISPL